MEFTLDNTRQTVQVPIGESFSVCLEGYPSAGFLWDLSTLFYGPHMPEKAHLYREDGTVGGPVPVVYTWVPVKKGRSRIEAFYRRPWETKLPANVFALDIEVI